MKRTVLTLALLCCTPAALFAAAYSGQVVDGLTGDGIAGADVIDAQGQKVKTGPEGKFTLETAAPQVVVVMPGFLEGKATLTPEGPNKISLNLKGLYQVETVEVKAKPDAKKVVVSKQHMEKEVIKKVTTPIFPDVAKTLQMLPGVTTNKDFSSLLYVRGGDSDEVIAVLDDMIIFSPYMWGGLVSVFNPNLVDNVDFATGGFSAEWPQAMSAILNVKNRVGNPEAFKGFVDVSAAALDVFVEGPVAGNLGGSQDSSFLLGLRRTYYDLQTKLYTHDNMVYPYFYDGQAKVTLPLSNGTVTFNSIFSVEGMDYLTKAEDGYGSAHTGDSNYHYLDTKVQAGLSYDLKLTDTVSVLTLAGFRYGDGSYDLVSNTPYHANQKEKVWQLRNIWQWLPNEHHIVKAGLNLFPGDAKINYTVTYKTPTHDNRYYEETLEQNTSVDYCYSGAFVQDDIEILDDFFFVNLGVNGQYYDANHQWIGNPRLAFKLKPAANWETYVAAGLYSQYSLSAGMMDEKVGNPHLLAEESRHYILGSKIDVGQDFFVQVETYYKEYANLITEDPDPNVNFTNNAIGHAYGADLIIQKKVGERWDGWLTYSYVRSERKITRRSDPALFGKAEYSTPVDTWYLADSDRPHTFNLIVNYTIKPKWKLSFTQKYCTGKPYTPVTSADYQPAIDEYAPNYGRFNSERMPDYISTDIKFSMPFFGLKGWSSYAQISNLFDNKNVDSYQYKTNYSDKRPIYQYPRAIIGGFRYDF